jgi:hypothetical protein
MNRIAYTLLFLLCSAQVDDVCAVTLAPSSARLADDGDDEYPPLRWRRQEEEVSAGQRPAFAGADTRAVIPALVRSSEPSGRGLTTRCALPPLYLLVSLQI